MADTEKKNPVAKSKGGRPSSFRHEYIEQAYKFALLGADDARMAKLFGVSTVTFNAWKTKYPEFFNALKEGKDIADAEISKALYHRAKGYSHPDVEVKVIDGQVVMVDLIKHYPPDTGAAMAWLKNRQPKYWRDKPEQADDQQSAPQRVEIVVKDARRDSDNGK
jgi:hypothetical protein